MCEYVFLVEEIEDELKQLCSGEEYNDVVKLIEQNALKNKDSRRTVVFASQDDKAFALSQIQKTV